MRVLVLLLLLLPAQGLALSCPYYDIPATFREYHAAPETYVVVYGQFADNPVKLSQTRDADILRYGFTGNAMTRQGTGPAFEQPVVVTRGKPNRMFSDPGGHVLTGIPVLLFLRKSGGEYLLDVTACRYGQFYEPSPRDLRKLVNCLRGLWCQKARY